MIRQRRSCFGASSRLLVGVRLKSKWSRRIRVRSSGGSRSAAQARESSSSDGGASTDMLNCTNERWACDAACARCERRDLDTQANGQPRAASLDFERLGKSELRRPDAREDQVRISFASCRRPQSSSLPSLTRPLRLVGRHLTPLGAAAPPRALCLSESVSLCVSSRQRLHEEPAAIRLASPHVARI